MSELSISSAYLPEDIVQMELATNLAGSDVLKHILSFPIVAMQGMSHVEVQAMAAVGYWYLWWLQRQLSMMRGYLRLAGLAACYNN